MMSRWTLIVILVVSFFGFSETTSANQPHTWDFRNRIIVEDRTTSEWESAVRFSVNAWRQVLPPEASLELRNASPSECPLKRGVIVICNVEDKNQTWSGIATTRTENGYITHAKIRFVGRPAVSPWNMPWSEGASMYDMTTLCHELGHAFGLPHNKNHETSCVTLYSIRIEPGSYDKQKLRLMYAADRDRR